MVGVRTAMIAICGMATAICCGCMAPTSFTPWASTAPPAANGLPAPNGLPIPNGSPATGAMPALNSAQMPQASAAGMPFPQSPAMNLPPTGGQRNPWASLSNAPDGSTAIGGIGSSLLDATDLLSEGMRIEPKVIPAPDPTKLDNRPSDPNGVASDLHYHAGRVYEGQNSLNFAAAHYRDALVRNPQDVHLLISYARVQDRMGNFLEAEAGYRQALELRPFEASAHNGLGLCYARQAKWDGAIQAMNEAIRLQPANSLYRNNLALILIDTGRTEEAFQQMVAAHGEAGAHYNLGYLLNERKRTQEAQWHFARALELNPYLEQAKQMLAQIAPPAPAVPQQQINAPSHIAGPMFNTPDSSRFPTPQTAVTSPTGFGHPIR